MNNGLEWGIPIIEWLQNLGAAWLVPMKFFSFLGTELFIMLIMPAFFWCYNASLGFRLGLALLVSSAVNSIVKIIFGWPRPYWVNTKVQALSSESTYGLPSGHAQNALVMWGRLAAAIPLLPVIIVSIALIIFISISRLYLGVHFPTDVLVGWLVGGTILLIFVIADKPVSQWLSRRSFRFQLLTAIIFPLTILTCGLLIVDSTTNRPVPEEWIQTAQAAAPEADPIDPQNPESLISGMGSLMGLCTGYVLLQHWGRFEIRGNLRKRVERFIVGVIGVVIIFFGLRMIFPEGTTFLAFTLRFLRYAAVGFWVAYLAPRVFVALKLA